MSISFAWLALAGTAAVLLTVTFVVMRTGSVAGPMRVADEPGSLRALSLVTLIGLSAWFVIPGFVALWMQGPTVPTMAPRTTAPSTTAPATAPAPAPMFTPQQSVLVSVIAGVGASAVLIGANVALRPGGLRRMGFSLDLLPRGFAAGFLASLIVLPFTFIAAVLTDWFWKAVGYEHPGVHEMLEILGKTTAPSLRGMIYASAIVVAPLFEELLFRGHIQTLFVGLFARMLASDDFVATAAPLEAEPTEASAQPVLDYAPPPAPRATRAGATVRWLAIMITSVLFALVHGEFWMMPPIFFLALCLGYVYERTGNLWAPATVHLLFNLANVTLFVNFA